MKADGEAYDRYVAELETVVRLLKKWLLRAPPNVGSQGQRDPQAAEPRPRHGRAVAGRDADRPRFRGAQRGGDPRPPFRGRPGQGAVRLRRRGRQFRLAAQRPAPPTCCSTICSARPPGVPGAWGHAIGGMGSITQAMARACREAGVDIVLNTPVEEVIVANGRAGGVVAGGKAWRGEDRRRRGQSRSCCSTGWCRRARSTPTSQRACTAGSAKARPSG